MSTYAHHGVPGVQQPMPSGPGGNDTPGREPPGLVDLLLLVLLVVVFAVIVVWLRRRAD